MIIKKDLDLKKVKFQTVQIILAKKLLNWKPKYKGKEGFKKD